MPHNSTSAALVTPSHACGSLCLCVHPRTLDRDPPHRKISGTRPNRPQRVQTCDRNRGAGGVGPAHPADLVDAPHPGGSALSRGRPRARLLCLRTRPYLIPLPECCTTCPEEHRSASEKLCEFATNKAPLCEFSNKYNPIPSVDAEGSYPLLQKKSTHNLTDSHGRGSGSRRGGATGSCRSSGACTQAATTLRLPPTSAYTPRPVIHPSLRRLPRLSTKNRADLYRDGG